MPYTIPSNTVTSGHTGLYADQNNTADVLSGMGAAYSVLNTAYAGGADPTGVADSTAAFQAAIAALPAAGGVITFPAGVFKITGSGTALSFGRNQGMRSVGSAVSTLSYQGTGTCAAAYDSSFSSSLSVGGGFSGFTIDGTSAGSAAVGMSWGNLLRGRCNDIRVANFTGATAIGLSFKNASPHYSEEAEWTAINVNNNTVNVCFDTGSFDYSAYRFTILAQPGQDGIRLQNDASLAGCTLAVFGNFSAGAGNTASVFNFDPGNASGTSRFNGCEIYVNVECDGLTGTGHTTISMAGGSSSQFLGQGVLQFNNETVSFTAASIAAPVQFGFSGRVYGSGVLGLMSPGDGLAVQGGSLWTEYGTLSTALPGTIFLKNGDVQDFLLSNGPNTVTFGSSLNRPRKIDLFLAQPATGNPGTVTWPGTTVWPRGTTAPSLSTTNGAVDHVRMLYLPSIGNWFAELVAPNSPPAWLSPAGLPLTAAGSQASVTSPVSLSTSAETVMASMTIPANDPAAGSIYRITAYGYSTTDATSGTVTINLTWGGSSIAQVATALTAALTNVFWQIDTIVTFVTASTCNASMRWFHNTAGAGAFPANVNMSGTASAATVTVNASEVLAIQGTNAATTHVTYVCTGSVPERVW